jgi:uncharacterized protein YbjT (DUF2867 family)
VVAGATGRVGAALVRRLANDPIDLVALTRTNNSDRVQNGHEVASVDFDEPETLTQALREASRLFIAHGTSDRQVADEIALIDAAVAAGISHIVKLSAMGPPTRLHPFDWHMEIERHLASKDVGYTVLRPGPFVNTLARAGEPVANDAWGGSAGSGSVNLIDTRDIADVARVALLDETFAASQRAYHLTGPNGMTMPEVAEVLSGLLGREVEYRHRSASEHRKILIAAGVTDMVADLLLGLDRLFLDSVLAETTNTVFDLTGQRPRPVSGWLRENLALFTRPV